MIESNEETCDVLVVGAGPVGLTMARQLALNKLNIVVVDVKIDFDERTNEEQHQSKALALHGRTLEHFKVCGFVESFLTNKNAFEGNSIRIGQKQHPLNLGWLEEITEFPYLIFIPQFITETVLRNEVRKLGVEVQWQTKVIGITQNENSVKVTCVNSKDEKIQRIINCKYLVGCDGAHSSVRKLVNIPFEGSDVDRKFYMVDAKIQTNFLGGGRSFFIWDSSVPMEDGKMHSCIQVAIPFAPKDTYRYLLHFPKDFPNLPENPTLEFFQEQWNLRNKGIPAKFSEPTWITKFTGRQRVAQKYREGRIFIAGDACHSHLPIGGQGMNTGIQDALNLSWKLSMILQGILFSHERIEMLLDSYEKERKPIAVDLVNRTGESTVKVFEHPFFGRLLEVAGVIQKLPKKLQTSILAPLEMLNQNYRNVNSLPMIPDRQFTFWDILTAPLSTSSQYMGWALSRGDRAPHSVFYSAENPEKPITTYSLFQIEPTKFHLLIFLESNYEVAQKIVDFFKQYRHIHVVIILKSRNLLEEARKYFQEKDLFYDTESGKTWETFYHKSNGMVIVRPDTYILSVFKFEDFERMKLNFEAGTNK